MAGPGLPGDMQPVDDGNKKRPQGGFLKPALGCLFHKAGPGLPRERQPGDDNGEKKTTPRRLKKAGHGLPFQMADPGLPGDRQPGMTTKEN